MPYSKYSHKWKKKKQYPSVLFLSLKLSFPSVFLYNFVCSVYWSQKLFFRPFFSRAHSRLRFNRYICVVFSFIFFSLPFFICNDLYKVNQEWTMITKKKIRQRENVRLIHRIQWSKLRFVLYINIQCVYFSTIEILIEKMNELKNHNNNTVEKKKYTSAHSKNTHQQHKSTVISLVIGYNLIRIFRKLKKKK